jgi:hypothetical protein
MILTSFQNRNLNVIPCDVKWNAYIHSSSVLTRHFHKSTTLRRNVQVFSEPSRAETERNVRIWLINETFTVERATLSEYTAVVVPFCRRVRQWQYRRVHGNGFSGGFLHPITILWGWCQSLLSEECEYYTEWASSMLLVLWTHIYVQGISAINS